MTQPECGVVLSREGQLVHLRLDGTESNALGSLRYGVLTQVAQVATEDEVLLLSAEGSSFSAGQNLREFVAARVEDRVGPLLEQGTDAVLALLECRATVVAAVQGPAVGGGALLAAAADVVVLGDSARLRLPELELGMPLGSAVLERLAPPAAARRLALTGAWADADEVTSWGGVVRVPDDRVLPRALEEARSLLRGDGQARAVARRLFGAGERARAAASYRAEVAATLDLLG